MSVGLYGGSFDPVHLGHIALITTASEQLDRLVVVVAGNSSKGTGLFTLDERVALLSEACHSLNNVSVVSHLGLLVDIAALVGADVLVRSAAKEHSDEKEMAYLNSRGGLPTLLIPPDPATVFISSSRVRGLIPAGVREGLCDMVPASVTARLRPESRPVWSV